MRFPAILLPILLATTAGLRAQLCAGEVRVSVLVAGDTVRFRVDSASYEPAQFSVRRLVSSDGAIGVRALPAEPHYHFPDAILRLRQGLSGFAVRTGCGNDVTIMLVRSRKGVEDTMLIAAENACDVQASLTVDFEPGHFSVVVCDTTRFPAATTEGWRYHRMPYVGSHWGGRHDATPSLTREDTPRAIDSAAERRLVRLVDRLGRSVDHAHADVRARLLPVASINPRWPGRRTPEPSENELPDRLVWQRLHRTADSGIYELVLPSRVSDAMVVELSVRVPGYVWWGPMPVAAWSRTVSGDTTKTDVTLTLDPGSSAELAPFNRMELRYDYFSRLVLVPVAASAGTLDAAALKGLPGVAAAFDDLTRRSDGDSRPRSILLLLDRDLLPSGDPLLERLRSDPRTADAGPAVRADVDGYGISSPYDRLGALPRRFTVYCDDAAAMRALAARHGVEAISIAPREMRWEIVAPAGTGNAIASIARSFAAARGVRSVELAVGPFDKAPPLD